MIPTEFEPLLEPLERFESIRKKAVRTGRRLCDLSYANPHAGIQEAAKAAISEALAEERLLHFQYSPYGGRVVVRRQVADALRDSHRLAFSFEDVVLTPGAMAALQLALRVACRPGGEVLIPTPCWLDYPLYARSLGLVPVMIPLAQPTFDIDVEAVAAACTERTCAILLSHPANPTGRNYGPDTLLRLSETLVNAEDRFGCEVTLITDETHRDFVDAGSFRSAATFYARTLVVYSFGKYHFMQGQRIGYVATSPKHPARAPVSAEMIRWARITGIATPTDLMQRTVPRLLALHYDDSWLGRWRGRFFDELSAMGYGVVRPDATLFLYVRTPIGYDDFGFTGALASSGVLVMPAPVFHHSGYFRVSLTGSESMLERSLPIFAGFGGE